MHSWISFDPPILTSGHPVSITSALEYILLLGENSLFLTVLRNILNILIYLSFHINFYSVKILFAFINIHVNDETRENRHLCNPKNSLTWTCLYSHLPKWEKQLRISPCWNSNFPSARLSVCLILCYIPSF